MSMVKCVKQYSYSTDLTEVLELLKRYNKAKNYFYSRYSGVNSLHKLKNYKKDIRDVLIKEGVCAMFGLQARQWKIALDDVISNIKSNWTNTKNRVNIAINNNTNLTDNEKHYLRYLLKSDELLSAILTYKPIVDTDKLKKLSKNIDRKPYILNLLRRYIRKYKCNIPKVNKSNVISLDSAMYKYKEVDGVLYIEVMGLRKGSRLSFKLKDRIRYSGNISLIVCESTNTIKIHKGLKIECKPLSVDNVNIVGVDKGYTKMLSCSDGKEYGVYLGKYLSERTEELNIKNAKRNKLWALAKKYKQEGNDSKANNILKNNLGYKKKDRQDDKFKSKLKSYINSEINRFMVESKPKEVVKEDLSFVSKGSHNKGKKYNRKMSQWIKGYIDERLEYKLSYHSIVLLDVNPAYTSQVCNICGRFGSRHNEKFKCEKCGVMDANINASKNILARKYDKEISKYTSYKEVKKILESRAVN